MAQPRRQTAIVALITWVVLILVVPALIYYAWVGQKRTELTRQNMQLLAMVAHRLDKLVENARRTAGNLAGDMGTQCEYLRSEYRKSQPYLVLREGSCNGEVNDVRVQGTGPRLELTLDKKKDDSKAPLALEVDFEQLRKYIPLESEFDEFMVVDDQLRVRFHRGSLRLQRIDDLQPRGGEGDDKKLDIRSGSGRYEVGIAGLDYQLYVQPLEFPKDPDRETWRVCGMVNEDAFRRKIFAISPYFILALILLLVYGLLSWPIFKLFVMTERERFRLTDGLAIFISTGVTLVFSTILLLCAGIYWELKDKSETSVEDIAKNVAKKLGKEIGTDLRWLQLQDNGSTVGAELPAAPAREARSVEWLGPKGEVLVSNDERLSKEPMSGRAFFRNLQGARKLRSPQGSGQVFDIECFRSQIDGTLTSVLAIPSVHPVQADSGVERTVTVMKTTLAAVHEPVLSPLYGFAVVGDDGSILFHSEPFRALDRVLYDQVADAARLEAAVRSGTTQVFTTRYLNRPHWLAVAPIIPKNDFHLVDNRALSAVAFLDKELANTVTLEVLLQAVAMAVSYMAVIFVAIPAIYLLVSYQVSRRTRLGSKSLLRADRPHVWLQWLWPDLEKKALYVLLTFYYGLLSIVLMRFLMFSKPEGWWWIAILFVPGLAILGKILAYLVWRRDSKQNPLRYLSWFLKAGVILKEKVNCFRNEEKKSNLYLQWHVAAAVALWITISILPAIGIFRISLEDLQRRVVKYESREWSQRLNRPEGSHTGTPAEYRSSLFDGSCAGAGDGDSGSPASGLWLMARRYDRLRPIYNRVSKALVYLASDSPCGKPPLSWHPGLSVLGFVFLLIVLIVLIVLWNWVSFSAQRLFYGRLDGEPRTVALEGPDWIADEWLRDELYRSGLTAPGALYSTQEQFDGRRWKESGRREVLECILEDAERSYRSLWNTCSEEERLVLVHLAQERLVNPKQVRIVRRLLQRGLVRRDPVLRLMNRSFAMFVRRTHMPQEVAKWEKSTTRVGWQHLRWALGGIMAVITLFLSATQRETLEGALKFLPALLIGVPGAMEVMNRLLSRSGES